MAFKQKPHRIKFSQETKTLDELHKEKITKFDESHKEIDLKKKKIILLKRKLNEISDEDIIDKIKKKINKYENEIKYLETSFDELEYFEKTKDILIQYFENKSHDNSSELPQEIIVNYDESLEQEEIVNDNNDDNILDRFNKLNDISNSRIKKKKPVKKRHQIQKIQKKSILDFLSQDNSGNTVSEPIKKIIHEKGTLRDQYLTLIDSSYACNKVKLSPIKICNKCDEELTLIQSEGRLVCQKCGDTTYIIIESEIPSHKDTINEKRKYPYNPINHLIEKINQFQAKQTTKIPPEIYAIIEKELKKNMIEKENVNPEIIEKILKKYKKEAFYEHHYLIFSHITNTPPPSLTREEEEDVKVKFKMIEKPFKLFKPKNRDNNPNYSVVLNKIFLIKAELENNQQMEINSRYFRLLKSREKLKKFDVLWKMICKYNGWPFHSSF